MLDWMKGTEQGVSAADNSKLLEPPETPAPVFAIRAFKSALFGTPGAEEDEEKKGEKQERASQPKKQAMGHQRSHSDSIKRPSEKVAVDTSTKPSDTDAMEPNASPTKSILVTPGTISNRRKTVSFGESVVDNERKEGSPRKLVKTPPNPQGNLSIQWMSGSSDGGSKPRSKLTQTLLDVRDNTSKNSGSAKSTEQLSSDANAVTRTRSKEESSNEDITINLEEPRSESGKYWKSEFDSYRVRTNREIRKLIHYRSIAKSYARKKDSEALRLADKLREEEEKVAEMEHHVTHLAATMAGKGSKADKEQLVQDLTTQTALALQYKQQVTSLRKLLERHNVVNGDATAVTEHIKDDRVPENTTDMRKMQQALDQANAQIEEMKRQPSDLNLSMLQGLAQSSEKKAQELEKENNTLKQTLARVKQEMSRYEGRRKDKETKLKQREIRLEARIQEYRDRLKTTSQEHREAEATLRSTFDEERRRMQDQIDLLKLRVAATERYPTLRSHERHSYNPRKDYTGVQVLDFAGRQEDPVDLREEDGTADLDAPPSPSPRSKTRDSRHTRYATIDAHEMRRATRPITADDDEVTHYLNEILPRPPQTRLTHHHHPQHNHAAGLDEVAPSSPPDMAAMKSLSRHKHHQLADGQSRYQTTTDDSAPMRAPSSRHRSHIKSTLDNVSTAPAPRSASYAAHHALASHGKRHGAGHDYGDSGGNGDDGQKEYLSPERVAAAKSRLKQKYDSRKSRALGKQNVRMMAVSSGVGAG